MPTLAMLCAIVLWATSASASKAVLDYVSVVEGFAFRIIGAAVVLWLVGLLVLRRDYRLANARPLLMGVLEPTAVTLLVMLGVSQTSAINAAVVWGILPVTQPLLGRLVLDEPVERSVVFGAALAVGGTALLFAVKQQDGSGSLTGDLLLVAAVSCAAVNQLLARSVARAGSDPVVTTSYQLATAAVLAGLILAATAPSEGTLYGDVHGAGVGLLIMLIITTAGPFLLYNYAMRHLSVGRISLFAPLTGPIGAVVASVVFDEPLVPLVLLAIVMTTTGALLPRLLRSGNTPG